MLVFIRHAEKVPWDPVHLSKEGRARAELLSDYFRHPCGLFEVPTVLVAMADGRSGHSHRCTETLRPTARTLDVPLDTRYAKGQGKKAARKALQKVHIGGSTVVLCWEHSELVDMVRSLGFERVLSWGLYPNEKHDGGKDCFDATWVIDTKRGILRVYHQFKVTECGQPSWPWPRTVPTCVIMRGGFWAKMRSTLRTLLGI